MNATAYLPSGLKPSNITIASRKSAPVKRSLSDELSRMTIESKPSSLRRIFGKMRSSSRERIAERKLERGMTNRAKSLKSIAPFMRLARHSNFDRITRILTEEGRDILAHWFDDCIASHKGQTSAPLHVILQRHPPVELISLLCQTLERVYPGVVPEDGVDAEGMTALTVALKAGCDFDVIVRLLNGKTSTLPTMTMDAQQRLPLHWACIPVGRKLRQGTDPKTKKAISTSTIRLLINAYPQARAMKDAGGQTPYDLAIKYLKKSYHHQILDDLMPDAVYQPFKSPIMSTSSPLTACPSNGVATAAMSTVENDIPREIFCIGDISHHKRIIEGNVHIYNGSGSNGSRCFLVDDDDDGGLDGADDGMDCFEQLEI